MLPHREGKLAVACLLVRRTRNSRVDHLKSVPIDKLLGWIYKWPASRTRDVLDQAGIKSENRLVGELTDRQRNALADILTDIPGSAETGQRA